MKSMSITRRGLTVTIIFVCAILVGGATVAGAWFWEPQILPIQEKYYGKTYGEWAAKWWQWALGTPADVNPNVGNGDCTVGQKGPVWFLATTLGSGAAVKRDCKIPIGKAIFFPLINASNAAFVTDPPEERTDAALRPGADCGIPTKLTAKIDGEEVKDLYLYFEHSPFFFAKIPYPNIYGLPDGIIPEDLVEGVDQGYYLFLEPLMPGKHTIEWTAAWTCPFGDFSEDITYNLTVKGH